MSPEATAAALGDAALAAAADEAGMPLEGGDVDAMQAYLAARWGGGGGAASGASEGEGEGEEGFEDL